MSFDPYAQWLGLSADRRPPTYYDLLALEAFETDPERIRSQAMGRMAHVRKFQLGSHGGEAQRLLEELSQAFVCLTDIRRKAAYDCELRGGVTRADSAVGDSKSLAQTVVETVYRDATVYRGEHVPQVSAQASPAKPRPIAIAATTVSTTAPEPAAGRRQRTPIVEAIAKGWLVFDGKLARVAGRAENTLVHNFLRVVCGGVGVGLGLGLLSAIAFSLPSPSKSNPPSRIAKSKNTNTPTTDPRQSPKEASNKPKEQGSPKPDKGRPGAIGDAGSAPITRATVPTEPVTPALAVAPFSADQAKQHQQAWATHLAIPVEATNSIGMKLALIPPGMFVMGSPVGEAGRKDDENQHDVSFSNEFYLGVHEVTQDEYSRVMGINPSSLQDGAIDDRGRRPVDMVSWEDAAAFCTQLSSLPEEMAAGRAYRLPTEAEWEYACRAGSKAAFCFGDDPSLLGDYAWHDEGAKGRTHPVGQKKPNAWGLYDMHGNVMEWCRDWHAPYPVGAATEPLGSASGSERVSRGGLSLLGPDVNRCAIRARLAPTQRFSVLGFRVVQVAGGTMPNSLSPATSEQNSPSPLAVAPFSADLEIIKAEYGAGEIQKDVTEEFRMIVGDLPLMGLASQSYNAILGGDPAPAIPKVLRVLYRINGKVSEASFLEDADIVLPLPK